MRVELRSPAFNFKLYYDIHSAAIKGDLDSLKDIANYLDIYISTQKFQHIDLSDENLYKIYAYP